MIKRFIAAWREANKVRQLTGNVDWQPIDAQAYLRFMTSSSGQKQAARLNNMVYRSMLAACSAESNGDYVRGAASGIITVIRALDSQLPQKVEQQDFSESDGVNTDISGLEQLATR